MNLTQPPWAYVWAAASSAVAVALVQLIFGDGIDWLVLVFIAAGAVVGTHIGIRRRQARSDPAGTSSDES